MIDHHTICLGNSGKIHQTILSHSEGSEMHVVGHCGPTNREVEHIELLAKAQKLAAANSQIPLIKVVYGHPQLLAKILKDDLPFVQVVPTDDCMRTSVYIWNASNAKCANPLSPVQARLSSTVFRTTHGKHVQTNKITGFMAKLVESCNVVRTWYYMTNIYRDYYMFNYCREATYGPRMGDHRPASTGIGLSQDLDLGNLIIGSAIQAGDVNAITKRLESPVQPEAGSYGSGFARGIEVKDADYRRLYISGTAAIDQEGQSIPGTPPIQLAHSVKAVEELMTKYEFDWSDVTRCVIYAKQPEAIAGEVSAIVEAVNPMIVQGLLCRPELSVELELDAIIQRR